MDIESSNSTVIDRKYLCHIVEIMSKAKWRKYLEVFRWMVHVHTNLSSLYQWIGQRGHEKLASMFATDMKHVRVWVVNSTKSTIKPI